MTLRGKKKELERLERLALDKRIERNAKKVRKWIASKEGKREIKRALKEAREGTQQFNEARKVDPKSLHDPVTI